MKLIGSSFYTMKTSWLESFMFASKQGKTIMSHFFHTPGKSETGNEKET